MSSNNIYSSSIDSLYLIITFYVYSMSYIPNFMFMKALIIINKLGGMYVVPCLRELWSNYLSVYHLSE